MVTTKQYPWQGIEIPDALRMTGVDLPLVQFVHDGGIFDPRQKTGGFFMPARWDTLIRGERVTGRFSGGDEEGVFTTVLSLVPVAWVKTWFDEDGNVLEEYQEGASSRLRLLALATTPDRRVFWFVLSVHGTASQDLEAALRQHTQAAAKVGGQPWMFRLVLQAGTPRRTEKGATVTPITTRPLAPEKAFVGEATCRFIIEHVGLIGEWRDEGRMSAFPRVVSYHDLQNGGKGQGPRAEEDEELDY